MTLDTVEVVLALKPDEVALDADELQVLAQGIAEAATGACYGKLVPLGTNLHAPKCMKSS